MIRFLIPAVAALATSLAAADSPDIELVEIRHELERAGIRVDHLADTPEERRRELRDIARQMRELRERREQRESRARPRGNRVGQGGGPSSRSGSIRRHRHDWSLGAKRKL